MSEAETLSALVQTIYDAALEPALWPATLHRVAGFVGGSAASLYAKDVVRRGADIFHDDGAMDESWVRRYTGHYVRLDPSTTRHFFTEVEQAVSTTDIMPFAEFEQTRFYEEWAKPQGLMDGLTAVLEKSGTRLEMFTVFRSADDGLIDDTARSRMHLIIPHVRRATLAASLVSGSASAAGALADVLDAVGAGVFLLGPFGRIVHCNDAGRAMLDAGRLFTAAGGRLALTDAEANLALAAALAAIVDGQADLAGRGAALPVRNRDGALFVAHVLPLGPRARDSGSKAQAVLFIRPATLARPAAPEALAKAYRLTPTELRVLLAVVEIGGTSEIAAALGISETTVKFHLRQLFAKTDTHRQADLVKRVAGFTSPSIG
ncbi:MAG: helix-turn-helix transcriptional regulator [Devosia sp.]|nr:helix-turn-helix transcriptional regulator [Devosia sp.]